MIIVHNTQISNTISQTKPVLTTNCVDMTW